MDEQSPPQKKVGSLRDRIAAFEKQSAAQPAAPPPIPRSKPSGISWKPKPASPPSSPSAQDAERESKVVSGSRASGMSAADAKESIGQGGSLKDRMAALQGKGAFGAPTPSAPPPRPASDKPKWKPPQPIALPAVDKDQPSQKYSNTESDQMGESVASADNAEGDEAAVDDPEDQERQRRAAIAARLQRIGGSKIGMGLPLFGSKPAVKKPSLPLNEEPDMADKDAGPPHPVSSKKGEERTSSVDSDHLDGPAAAPRLSSESVTEDYPPSDNATVVKSSSMPVPVVPRRAAPPWRKAAKSPNPATAESNEPTPGEPQLVSSIDSEPEPKIKSPLDVARFETEKTENEEQQQQQTSSDSQYPKENVEPNAEVLVDQPLSSLSVADLSTLKEPEHLESSLVVDNEEEQTVISEGDKDEHLVPDVVERLENALEAGDIPKSLTVESFVEEQVDEEVEDDADRRASIAERLSKSGAINPLVASPLGQKFPTSASRKSSMDSHRGPPSRKTTMDSSIPARKSSMDTNIVVAPASNMEGDTVQDIHSQTQEQTEREETIGLEDVYEQDDEEEEDLMMHQEQATPPPLPPPTSRPRPSTVSQSMSEDDGVKGPRLAESVHVGNYDQENSRPSFSPKRNTVSPPRPPSYLQSPVQDTEHTENVGIVVPPRPQPMIPQSPVTAAAESQRRHQTLSPVGNRFSVPPHPPPSLPNKPEIASSHEDVSSDSSYEEEAEISMELPSHSMHEAPAISFSDSEPEREVLDESHGDPIDPGYYSSLVSPKRTIPPPITSPRHEPSTTAQTEDIQPAQVEQEEDEDHARKRSLADRMAKLGGIRFGAPPPIHRPAIVPRDEHLEEESREEGGGQDVETEADEQARRQRIAAKLAGMGGMRFGMLPPGIPGAQHPTAMISRPPDVAPAPVDVESISEDDGVKVEAEESEIEEVNYKDAQEEAPPPIPAREARMLVTPKSPPQSGGRPPIPGSGTFTRKPSRKSSSDVSANYQPSRIVPSQSEYVMVEEPESFEVPPLLPPSRARQNSVPPSAPPVDAADNSTFSQWELPSIPNVSHELGRTVDLSLSTWSEDSTTYPSGTARSVSSPTGKDESATQEGLALSVDQLTSVWGRVGVQICEVAAELHEKSKKTLIGDGSYIGFLNTVLSRVPNATSFDPTSSPSPGYLIYAQSGALVQRRTADIMPGDIVMIQDAKLKGHKGLQTYHQTVGEGEPLFGVVGEFEAKKSKLRVYQANQHVGHQTVESVSYRLEDLKSGVVKVFRVLES